MADKLRGFFLRETLYHASAFRAYEVKGAVRSLFYLGGMLGLFDPAAHAYVGAGTLFCKSVPGYLLAAVGTDEFTRAAL